jgi:hypothetical protein
MEDKKYKCDLCQFFTSNKSCLARHYASKKHEKMYEEQEKQAEMKDQIKEDYDIKLETLKEEYENKLFDKNEIIKDLENQLKELKADLIICERDRDRFENNYKEVNTMVTERVCFLTQEINNELQLMKNKMEIINIEREHETKILNDNKIQCNKNIKEIEDKYERLIETMKLQHENEVLKAQLHIKQDVIDLSYNVIQTHSTQPIQIQAPYKSIQTTPKIKPKPEPAYDFLDSEIEIQQIGMEWKTEYPFEDVVNKIYTDDELGPKLYKEYLKGKEYEICFMEILCKEIKKDSFYYKTEKDRQTEIFQLYYREDWLSPEESHAKLYEVIRTAVNYIYWFEHYRDMCVFDYCEKYKTPKPPDSSDLDMFYYPKIKEIHRAKFDDNYDRMQKEHSIRAEDETKYINKIKSRILKNVLI